MGFLRQWITAEDKHTGKVWIARISARLSLDDRNRLRRESVSAAHDQLKQRIGELTRPEDFCTTLKTDEHLVHFSTDQQVGSEDNPTRGVKRLLEGLSAPVLTIEGLVFPRVNAAFTLAPCKSADTATPGLLAIALRRARRAGPGVAAGVDPGGGGALRLFGLDTPDIALDLAIRRAIDAQRVIMHYQPVIRLGDGRVASVEALMRIATPGGLLISPRRFIDTAERSGLIAELSRLALRDAAARMEEWRDSLGAAAPERIAVNVSAAQLCEPGFAAEAAAIFSEVGVDALTIEITESALIRELPRALAALESLRSSGVRIALDDFGVEYSSLSHLRHIPVDVLKIDQSFLEDVPGDDRATRIFTKIVELGHILGAEVVAEGVETAAHTGALLASGVQYGQGEYFGIAMDPDQSTDFLREAAIQAAPPPAESVAGETPRSARA